MLYTLIILTKGTLSAIVDSRRGRGIGNTHRLAVVKLCSIHVTVYRGITVPVLAIPDDF